MSSRLDGVKVAVLGGDRREVVLAVGLAEQGAAVRAVGFPPQAQLADVELVHTIEAAVNEADAIIAPVTNTDDAGRIKSVLDGTELFLNTETLRGVPAGTPLLIGYAKPVIKVLATQLSLRLVETAELDPIAVLNSIPTAEGAIQLAMEKMPITIHGSDCVVIGFGRCGVTLARDLAALGARTSVVARNPGQLARAEEMALVPVPLESCGEALQAADCIFNTVPAPVLTRAYLSRLRKETLIVDLASAPGGVDFEAAMELGLTAILALGLPGKVAPITAGRILARHVPALISGLLKGTKG